MPLLVFLSVFGVYLGALYPSIAPEDSGEFVTAAWTLGIPHASGYSLYTLLGKTSVVLIPFGNPAYRVNILSALLGAGAILVLADILRHVFPTKPDRPHVLAELEQNRWRNTSIWITALLWAFVPGVWYLSLLAEVYVLQIFIALWLLWAMVRFFSTNVFLSNKVAHRFLYLSAFLFGLGTAVHHTLVFWVPGLLGFVLTKRAFLRFVKPHSMSQDPAKPFWTSETLRQRVIPVMVFITIGFSVQAFLAVRASVDPLLNTGAPDTLVRFVRVLLRQDYGTFSLFKGTPASFWPPLKIYLVYLTNAFTPIGLLFLGWGAYRAARHSWPLFRGLTLLWFFSGPVFVMISRAPMENHFQGIMERFYPLSFIPLVVLLGFGLYEAGLNRVSLKWMAVFLIPLSFVNHVSVSGRGNLHALDFGHNILKSMPFKSILWDPGDSAAYSVLYHQAVRKNREDIASVHYHTTYWGQRELLSRYPDLVNDPPPPFQELLYRPHFLRDVLNGPRREWLFVEVPKSLPGIVPNQDYPVLRTYPKDGLPMGLAYRFFPSESHRLIYPRSQLSLARLTFWWYRQSQSWRIPSGGAGPFGPPTIQTKDPFTVEILQRYAEAHTNMGQKFAQYDFDDLAEAEYHAALTLDSGQMEAFNNLGVLAHEKRDMEKAAAYFKRALKADPGNAGLYRNWGYAYYDTHMDLAVEAFRKSLEFDPNHPDALFRLADLLEKRERPAEALTYWKKLRDVTPEDKAVYWRMTHAYILLEQPDEAEKTINRYTRFSLTDQERALADELMIDIISLKSKLLDAVIH